MRIGIDIGGTKLEAAALDGDGGLHLRRRVPTPRGDYAATVEAIAELVESIESELGRRCTLSFGIPGTISPATGLIKNAYNSPFNGHPLGRDLATRFNRPVRQMNDANCFALSEAHGGAAAGAEIVFGAILGTGCGSGIVVRGELLTGANAVSGEWGHNPLPWPKDNEIPGLRCDCGKHGCIETFISVTGLSRQHTASTSEQLSAEEIVAPDVIVLGGGMSNVARLYENIPAQWSDWVFSNRVTTQLRPPRLGDSSGVRGAAWLWPEGVEP